jgi:hypothetical protein
MMYSTRPTEEIEFYKGHYLCLWEITDDEIIGRLECEDLAMIDGWYGGIVLAAFRDVIK